MRATTSSSNHSPSSTGMMPSSSGAKLSSLERPAHLGQVVLQRVAGVGQDEAGLVQAVAAHHAAHGVGEEGGHVLAPVGPRQGDLLLRDLGGELVLEAVGLDPEAVVLGLELLHAGDVGPEVGLPVAPGGLQGRALQLGAQKGQVLEVPGGLEVVPVGAGEGDGCLQRGRTEASHLAATWQRVLHLSESRNSGRGQSSAARRTCHDSWFSKH